MEKTSQEVKTDVFFQLQQELLVQLQNNSCQSAAGMNLSIFSYTEGLLVRDRGGLLSCCRYKKNTLQPMLPQQGVMIMMVCPALYWFITQRQTTNRTRQKQWHPPSSIIHRRPDSVLLPHPPLQLSLLSDALTLTKWCRLLDFSQLPFRISNIFF